MIALDFRKYGNRLTLADCDQLYEDLIQIMTPLPVKIGIKGRIVVLPDECWITPEQHKNIFSDGELLWNNWRSIKLISKEL